VCFTRTVSVAALVSASTMCSRPPAPAAGAPAPAAGSLHPHVATVSRLLGSWRGSGRGFFPGIADFQYEEELEFMASDKPVVFMRQRTWSPRDQSTMHVESGYWRLPKAGQLEMLISQASGISEQHHGTVSAPDNATLVFSAKSDKVISTNSTAGARVLAVERVYRLYHDSSKSCDALEYTLSMSTEKTHTLTKHLQATLYKQPAKARL
jgi:hypothetical protein